MEIKEIAEKIRKVMGAHPKLRPLDANGKFYGNPTPVAPPIGYKKQPSLHEQIREMVRSEKLRQEVEAAGFETLEEADDFDVGDDYDPTSPYEYNFDPDPGPRPPPAAAGSPQQTGEGGAAAVGAQPKDAPPPAAPKGAPSQNAAPAGE